MIIDEERKKYCEIKDKLVSYRQHLEDEKELIDKVKDNDIQYMLQEINARQIYQYEKNKLRPYFAKIIFCKDDQIEPEIVYIGRIGFANLDDDIIIDWRAPISDLYYNSRLGSASYKTEENFVISGELTLKRQINFENGEIISVYDLDNSISGDEFLQPYLNASADNRLKNIIATIQEEQDKIIRMPLGDNLIVQGVAGSGKTTVALHRLSYLIYNNRKSIKPDKYFIISPNMIFKSYISSLLEELDADQVNSSSMEDIINVFINKEYRILNKHEMHDILEQKGENDDFLRFKGSEEFVQVIDKFIEDYEKEFSCQDFLVKGIKILDKSVLYDKYIHNKKSTIENSVFVWANAMDSFVKDNEEIEEHIKNLYVTDKISFNQKIEIERELQKSIKGKIFKFYKKKSLMELYKKCINQIERYTDYKYSKILKKYTLDNLNKNIISYDDIGALIYLYTKVFNQNEFEDIKLVAIDEAQDLSFLTFKALKELFKQANFSIFGDMAQGIYGYQSINKWSEIASIYDSPKFLHLNKSYRTTIEITSFANETLKKMDYQLADNVIRHGEKVRQIETMQVKDMILQEIEQSKKKGFKSCAVICKDKNELYKANELLKGIVKMQEENDSDYDDNQTVLLTLESAKGLEFDFVIIYDSGSYEDNLLDNKRYYVAQTRALHELVIINQKK